MAQSYSIILKRYSNEDLFWEKNIISLDKVFSEETTGHPDLVIFHRFSPFSVILFCTLRKL